MKESRTNRIILGSVVIGALLLLLGAAAYLVARVRLGANPAALEPLMVTLLIVVLLAVSSVAATYVTRTLRDKKLSVLDDEHRETLNVISYLIGNANLSLYQKRDIENEVFDMLLLAQEDGRSARDVTGGDTQRFVDQIVKAYGATPGPAVNLLTSLQYFILFIIAAQMYTFLESTDSPGSFFATGIGNMTILFFLMISLAQPFFARMLRHSVAKGNGALLIPFILVLAAILVAFVASTKLLRTYLGNLGWIAALVAFCLWAPGGSNSTFVR